MRLWQSWQTNLANLANRGSQSRIRSYVRCVNAAPTRFLGLTSSLELANLVRTSRKGNRPAEPRSRGARGIPACRGHYPLDAWVQGLAPAGGTNPAPQEELAEPMARAELVLLSRLAGADEIPERLVRRIGDPDWREIARPVAPGQLLGVTAVGLHPVTWLGGHRRWLDSLHLDLPALAATLADYLHEVDHAAARL